MTMTMTMTLTLAMTTATTTTDDCDDDHDDDCDDDLTCRAFRHKRESDTFTPYGDDDDHSIDDSSARSSISKMIVSIHCLVRLSCFLILT